MSIASAKHSDADGAQTTRLGRLARQARELTSTARFAWATALIVFVALALLTEVLLRFRADEVLAARNAATQAFASELRARADRELNSALYLASGFVGYLVVRHERMDPDETRRIMAAVHANSRHIRNFSVAVGYTPTYVFPLAGNEAILGRDYRDLPAQWPAVKLAVESRKPVLTGPVDLVQGGRALIYRTPIFVQDRYWGLLATVIDMPSFAQAAFAGLDGERYDFAIRSVERSASGGGLLWGRAELFSDPSALTLEAAVPNGRWVYAVRARQAISAWLDWVLRATGWTMALLTGLCVSVVLRQRSELARHAGYDSLTDLPNRRLFNDRLEQSFRRHRRDPRGQIGALFLDLDGFKPINDLYGHKAGDHVLRTVAARIREVVRAGDTVARWAGDEFVIIVDNADAALLAQFSARLRESIAAPCEVAATTLRLRVSIGTALYPSEAASADGLLELADSRMYQDKTGSHAD